MILLRKLFEIFSCFFLTSSDHPRPNVFCLMMMKMMKVPKHHKRSKAAPKSVYYRCKASFTRTLKTAHCPCNTHARHHCAVPFLAGAWPHCLALLFRSLARADCVANCGELASVDKFDCLQLDKCVALDELQLDKCVALDELQLEVRGARRAVPRGLLRCAALGRLGFAVGFTLKFKVALAVELEAAQFRKASACEFADGGEAV